MFTWEASLDSKGRITVPSRIRNKLGIEFGDSITLAVTSDRVILREVDSQEEVLKTISSLDSVQSFQYKEGVLEVVLNG